MAVRETKTREKTSRRGGARRQEEGDGDKMLARIVAYLSLSYTHTHHQTLHPHTQHYISFRRAHSPVRALGLVTGVGIELGVCLVRE